MTSKFDRAPDRLNATVDDDAHFQQSLADLSRQLAGRARNPPADEPSLPKATGPETETPTPPPSPSERAPNPAAQSVIRKVVHRAPQSLEPAPFSAESAPPPATAASSQLDPPKLGPAVEKPLRSAAARPPLIDLGLRKLAALPRKTLARLKHPSGFGYVILWSLVIGLGAVAAGAFVGFLVNGPPHRSTLHTIADVVPPTPAVVPAAPQKIVETRAAPPASSAAAPAERLPALRPPAMEATHESPATAVPEPQPNGSSLAAGEIREVQGRLRAAGFNPGPIDGSAGPMTTTAVKQYQQARGLAPTGAVDRDVLAKLRQEVPPRQQARAPARNYAAAPPQPSRRGDFLDSLDRMFRGRADAP